jgi:DNA mismatch repair protein MutL
MPGGEYRPIRPGREALERAAAFQAPATGQAAFDLSPSPVPGLAEEAAPFLAMPPGDAAPLHDDGPPAVGQPLGRVRAQLHDTYILAETADGLVLIDQHAAHERLTHERLKRALAAGGVARQILLLPEVVELDPLACSRLTARIEDLALLGFGIEPFGDGAVLVREVPGLLGDRDVAGLVRDLADEFANLDEGLALQARLDHACATLACHSSIRAGRKLRHEEMDALLRAMEQTAYAGQCSHGRPTYIELKRADIERLFGRR